MLAEAPSAIEDVTCDGEVRLGKLPLLPVWSATQAKSEPVQLNI